MKQGEIYNGYEDEVANARKSGMNEGVDEFYYTVLRNPITIIALVNARDKYTVLAILKRQYDEFKDTIV